MAELGRRDVVGDPLALNVGAQPAVRDLATMGVRNPGQTGGDAVYRDQMNAMDMLGQLGQTITGVLEAKQEEWLTEGQLQYMQGATEADIAATGNKWTMQGWQSLHTADAANRWFANELASIQNGGRELGPEQYGKLMMEKRAQFMQNLPEDPTVRKMYAAAFADLGPRLVAQQVAAHNEWNQQQTALGFQNLLSSGSYTNFDAPARSGNSPLALSNGVVRTTVEGYSNSDVDLLTRMVLGEAGGEGQTGMAAVAHVAMNRVIDGGYGGRSFAGVLTPSQFNGLQGSEKWDQNSIAYQTARQVVMDVLSGHNVDPTNGATHFVSGGIRPDWWTSVQGTGSITKIGGHEFIGAARNLGVGNSPSTGALNFRHPEQQNLNPTFANMLSNTALQLGINLDINSGQRSEARNKAVGGADGSLHIDGIAADIDISGMSDAEKQNLVRTLRANGATQFITYSNTGHLHVDMGTPKSGAAEWFMHDSSNENMGRAPAWFQAVSAEPPPANGTNIAANVGSDPQAVTDAAGVATANTVSIAQTQMQETIRSVNMPQDQKAAYVAQELITQLGAGSTQLWDGIGGIGFLNELGATPTQIRQVQNAHDQYRKDQLNKFDIEREQWSAGLAVQVANGSITQEEAYAQIQERYDSGRISDQDAASLVGKVVTAENSATDPWVLDPEFQERLGTIYANLRSDPFQFGAAYSQAQIELLGQEMAQKYGTDVTTEDMQEYILKVWQLQDSERAQLENATATAARQAATEQAKMDEAKAALARPGGLSNLTGTINGRPAVQWAIDYRRQQLMEASQPAIAGYMETGMTEQEAMIKADAEIDSIMWSELYRHGVVDQTLQASMQSAVSGNLVAANGDVYPDVLQAFDTFLRMRNTEGVGPAYAAKYFGDNEDARTKMMLAESLYSGGLNLQDALRKASEITAGGATPADVRTTENFTRNLNSALNDNFDRLLGDVGWGSQSSIKPEELQYAKDNSGALRAAIERRAIAYFAAEPHIDPQVLIKKAGEDVVNQATIVGGNLLLPRDAHAETFIQQMRLTDGAGLTSYDADTPNQVIRTFLTELYKDFDVSLDPEEKAWAQAWGNRMESLASYGLSRTAYATPMGGGGLAAAFSGDNMPDRDPPFHVSWDQDAGTVTISIWEDGTRQRTLGVDDGVSSRAFSLAEIGAWYKDRSKPTPNELQNQWNNLWDWHKDGGLNQPSQGEVVGGIIGGMVGE